MKKINVFLSAALILLGIACGIVSTYATINPIQKAFSGDIKYIMIGLFIMITLFSSKPSTIQYSCTIFVRQYVVVQCFANFVFLHSLKGGWRILGIFS
jgi:hypothetical protein